MEEYFIGRCKMRNYCIVMIAERDYEFFTNVATELQKLGAKVTLLSYHTPHKNRLHPANLNIIFFQDLIKQYEARIDISGDLDASWVLHESITYSVNSKNLEKKFQRYEQIAEAFLCEHRFDYVIQELGGFVAPLSLYRACLSTKTTHLFIEPTFLKGHLGFIKNDLSYKISSVAAENKSFDAESYISQLLIEKTRVIPQKDAHHFKEVNLIKFLNMRNLKNLVHKLLYRYFFRMEFEYKFVAVFINRAIKALINKKQLSNKYRDLNFLIEQAKTHQCFFFPFHVKLDFSLTVRSPENLDQLSVVNRVCELIGENDLLFVKEHPASSGAYGMKDLKTLTHPEKVIWLRPNEQTFDIIQQCKSVFTINSKAGVEAMVMGVPVFCAGDSYYLGEGLALGIEEFSQNDLADLTPDKQSLLNFVSNLASKSFSCELYQNDTKNITDFSDAIITATKEHRYLNVS